MDIRIKELFERYQSGKASEEEKKLVEDWFAGFDHEQQKILNEDKNAKFFSQMDQEMYSMFPVHEKKYRLSTLWLQVAAILLIGSGLFLFKIFSNRDNLTQPVAYTLISAPKGIKKQFALSDGSFVYLNSGSGIRVPSNFGIDNREVLLSGEAFFVVTHNKSKPFTIKSGSLVIADVGTAFNVRAYPDDKQIRVAVESGEVSVEKSDVKRRLKMIAGSLVHNQQLIYNKQSQDYIQNNVQTSDISAWKQNKLRFDNASFDEIAGTLERWYDVKVILKNDSRYLRHYTVSFNNEPINKVLYVLQKLSGMNYQINNKNIVVNLNNCKKQ